MTTNPINKRIQQEIEQHIQKRRAIRSVQEARFKAASKTIKHQLMSKTV